MSFWNKITGGLKSIGGAIGGGLLGGLVMGPVGTALGAFGGATGKGPFGAFSPGGVSSSGTYTPAAGLPPPNVTTAPAPSAPGRADWISNANFQQPGDPGRASMMAGGYDPSNPLSMPGVRDYYGGYNDALSGSQGQMLGGAGPASGTISQQQDLANALNLQMQGRGPSLAGNLLQQAEQNNLAGAMSMAGSQRGINRGLALRNAGEAASAANASADQQAAQARIQEQLGAQGMLAGVLGQMGGMQLGQQQAGTQAFGTAGGLENQSNATDMQGHIAQGQLALGRYQTDTGADTARYLGNLQSATQRYGIDNSTALGRYGIDTSADTARYGIGTNYSLGTQQLAMQPYLAQMGQNFQQSMLNQQMNAAQHTGGIFGHGGFLGLGFDKGGEVPGYDDGGFVSDYGAEEEPGTGGSDSIPGSASASMDSSGSADVLGVLAKVMGAMGGQMQGSQGPQGMGSLAGAGVGGPGDPQVVNPNYNPYQGSADKSSGQLLQMAAMILPFLNQGGEVQSPLPPWLMPRPPQQAALPMPKQPEEEKGEKKEPKVQVDSGMENDAAIAKANVKKFAHGGPVPEAKTADDKDYKHHGKDSNDKEKTEGPPSGQSGGEVPGYAKGGYTGLINGPTPNPTMPAPMPGMSALPAVAPLIPKPEGPLDVFANAMPILASLLPGNLGAVAGPISAVVANQLGLGSPAATNLGMILPLIMKMKADKAAQTQRQQIQKIVGEQSNSSYTGEPNAPESGSYVSDKYAAAPDESISGAGETAGDAHGGEIDRTGGGRVPGEPEQPGKDVKSNDTVPAMLTPKEIVLPLSVTQAEDAPTAAYNFVAALKSKNGEPSGYGKVLAAKARAKRG